MRTQWLVLGLLGATALAGCTGSDDGGAQSVEDDEGGGSLMVSHTESSELTRIRIEEAPMMAMAYEELMVAVDGKMHRFGAFLDYEDRRYQVDGKQDAAEAVEAGDMINVAAAGVVQVELWRGSALLASFEAVVPDNRAPKAVNILEPAHEAEGVSATPTFRWTASADPSGTRYLLGYSLDPAVTAPALSTEVADLTATEHVVPAGQELQSGQTYYWHVQAIDGSGNASPWSQVGQFKVA